MYDPTQPFNPQGDVIRHYTENAPDAEYVALQQYGIKDLTPLMPSLAKLRKMKHLNLSGNNLSRLPAQMSSLVSLETLDISQNPFRKAESIVAGLYSLPNLLHLKVNLPEAEENKLILTLTNVMSVNGVMLDDDEVDPDEMLKKEELRAAKEIAPLPRGYEISKEGVKLQLNFRPWGPSDSEKFSSLYQMVSKVSGKVASPEEYKDFSNTVLTHFQARTKSEADVLKLQVHQFNASALLMEFSFDELARVCSRFGSDVSMAMQAMYEQHTRLMRQASLTMSVMQEDRDRRIAALQEDLKRELLYRERTQRAYEAHFGATFAGGKIQFNDEEMQQEPVDEKPFKNSSSPPRVHHGLGFESESSPTGKGAMRPRVLQPNNDITESMSLSELRSFLKLLFESKATHDHANSMAMLPPETIEQHIFTLLCSKTSKEETIKRRIATIYTAVAEFSRTEIDIKVFSLVLKNRLDEEYYHQHLKYENIVYDSLQSVVVAGHTDRKNINALSPVAGGELSGNLSEKQTKEVVDAVLPWPPEARNRLLKRISSHMRREEFEEDSYIIGYSLLADVILNFFLEEHQETISGFVEQYAIIDTDNSGALDVNQFKRVLSVLFPDLSSWEAQQMVQAADPFSNNVINFNTAVRVIGGYKEGQRQAHDEGLIGKIQSQGLRGGYPLRNPHQSSSERSPSQQDGGAYAANKRFNNGYADRAPSNASGGYPEPPNGGRSADVSVSRDASPAANLSHQLQRPVTGGSGANAQGGGVWGGVTQSAYREIPRR